MARSVPDNNQGSESSVNLSQGVEDNRDGERPTE